MSLPPFDDSRKALVFALNATDVQMPRPAMNKAMAQGAKKEETKAAAKRRKKALAKAGVLEAEVTPRTPTKHVDSAQEARRAAQKEWLGLDTPAQAGLILREFEKLDREHRVILTGLLVQPLVACSCRAPCCSGWAKVPRWTKAVQDTLELLKESTDLVRMPGKKGLGTQPELRRCIVQEFYEKDRVEPRSLAALARMAGVSAITAAKHRGWILEGLQRIENEAWLQIDAMFDQAGITGTIVE